MTEQTHNFEADTGKILNIVINSLYSDRDIFLRELLSNASDAIHKRKLLGQTQPDILNSAEDEILVAVDDKKKTVEIIDTDAEGRLIMADALAFSEKYKPKLCIDISTLTGVNEYFFGGKGSREF